MSKRINTRLVQVQVKPLFYANETPIICTYTPRVGKYYLIIR